MRTECTSIRLGLAGRVPASNRSGDRRCRGTQRPGFAFTLLEVMIAMAIFFLAVFSILELVSVSLRSARSLQLYSPHASMLAAKLAMTNLLEEGVQRGDFHEFGELYDGFEWEQEVNLVSTNGLYEVNIAVFDFRQGRAPLNSTLSILLYRPETIQGGVRPGGRPGGFRR